MVIDFSNKSLISEDYLRAVGSWTKWMLGRMFGDDLSIGAKLKEEESDEVSNSNFVIRGKYRDIKAYAQAIGREKDYIVAYSKHGEDHPITVKAKEELDAASSHFTRLTGIEWPFK